MRPLRILLCALAIASSIGSITRAAENGLHRFVEPDSFAGALGVNIHFTAGHRRDIEHIAASGFKVVRSDLLWAQIETERGQYDWRGTDELIRELHENHLVPLLILAYSNPLYAPRVAGRPATDSLAFAAPETGGSRAAYMAFVRAAARRYGDRVLWEIWNEPDHNFGAPVNLRSYIGFAQEACQHLREIQPKATVIGPAASGFLWWFLQAFAEADRGHCFDAVSVHPYRDEAPESVLRDWTRARTLLPDCPTSSRCLTLADSEWGYSVTDGPWTRQRQADFDVRLRLLDLMAGIPLTIVYDWQDDGPDPADKEANFGLLDVHGAPKPAFAALQAMAHDLSGLRYMGRLATNRRSDFVLAFGAEGTVRKLVGWTDHSPGTEFVLPDPICVNTRVIEAAQFRASSCGRDSFPLHAEGTLLLSSSPTAIPVEPGPDGVARVRIVQRRSSNKE